MKPLDIAKLQEHVQRIADLRRERANWEIFAQSAADRIRRLTTEIESDRQAIGIMIAEATDPPYRTAPAADSAIVAPDVLPDVAPAA